MKRSLVVGVAVALIGGAVSAQAQSWTAIGSPNNVSAGQQYWDNTSSDGAHCNAGYVVTGVAGTSGNSCGNQRPGGWLPYTGDHATTYLEATGGGYTPIVFGSGMYAFSLLTDAGSGGGDIAAANQDWGYYDVSTLARTSLNGGLPAGDVTMSGSWGLYVLMTDGSYAYSGSDNQFALFGFNDAGSAPATLGAEGDSWIAGIEDIYTGPNGGSDKDYQDMLFRIDDDGPGTTESVVPEPATMSLLAFGLVGLAGFKRRRKTA